MPRIKSTKAVKAKSKRKYYKRKVKRNKTNVIPKSIANLGVGFPKMLQVTHKYLGSVVLTSTVGSFATHQFSCNGLYDPDITQAGHQAYCFDQLNVIYEQYVVIGSKCTVKFVPSGTNVGAISVGGYINNNTTTGPSSFPTVAELGWGKVHYMNYYQEKPTTIVLKWSAKKWHGQGVLNNPNLIGNSGANPTEQSYFQIFAQPIDGSSSMTMYAEVMLEYVAIWKELIDFGGS